LSDTLSILLFPASATPLFPRDSSLPNALSDIDDHRVTRSLKHTDT